MDLPESSRYSEWQRLPPARGLSAFGFAIEYSRAWSLEFQSLMARTAAVSSAAGTGAAHGVAPIPQKDRCTTTLETLTND
jgi:hypothetical protein